MKKTDIKKIYQNRLRSFSQRIRRMQEKMQSMDAIKIKMASLIDKLSAIEAERNKLKDELEFYKAYLIKLEKENNQLHKSLILCESRLERKTKLLNEYLGDEADDLTIDFAKIHAANKLKKLRAKL